MDDSFNLEMTGHIDSDTIEDFFYYQEVAYINQNLEKPDWNSKYIELTEFKDKLCRNNDIIKPEDFTILKQFAVAKGGFLTNELRKEFWKRIFCIEHIDKKNYELVYINENSKCYEDYREAFVFRQEPFGIGIYTFNIEIKNDFKHIINVDVKRSKINRIFGEGYNDTKYVLLFYFSQSLKKKLYDFINTLATVNNNTYKYFQGYHDIGLYFLMLYVQNLPLAVSVFQRFSEFNLKEFLLAHDEIGFGFDKVLIILLEAIKEIDSSVALFLILKGLEQPSFVLSWIITYFTHDIKSSVLQYRIFDYLICSHPLSIFFMTALIVVDEVNIIKKNPNLELSDFFVHFQNLDLDSLNFDDYIARTEKVMNKLDKKFYIKFVNYKNYFYNSGTVTFSLSE
jgi:hypothetical protein